ncbi:hypothetical protein ACSQ67_010131 [Phaseolus vulgaris]
MLVTMDSNGCVVNCSPLFVGKEYVEWKLEKLSFLKYINIELLKFKCAKEIWDIYNQESKKDALVDVVVETSTDDAVDANT